MGALIDSSVLIASQRGDLDLETKLVDYTETDLAVAAITASELLHGVHRADDEARRAHDQELHELRSKTAGRQRGRRMACLHEEADAHQCQDDVEDLGGGTARVFHLRRARHGGERCVEDRRLVFRGNGMAQPWVGFSPEARHLNAPSIGPGSPSRTEQRRSRNG